MRMGGTADEVCEPEPPIPFEGDPFVSPGDLCPVCWTRFVGVRRDMVVVGGAVRTRSVRCCRERNGAYEDQQSRVSDGNPNHARDLPMSPLRWTAPLDAERTTYERQPP